LGASVSLGEHEVHWRDFLQSLVERGLGGVQLIVCSRRARSGEKRRLWRPALATLPVSFAAECAKLRATT
ncbi:MAG: hypothetical protein GY811_27475, partial [Myxococcales bacterium]|nr:hypothetical protein [Myxococcales bacterium]